VVSLRDLDQARLSALSKQASHACSSCCALSIGRAALKACSLAADV
jgi:hypothetical protein